MACWLTSKSPRMTRIASPSCWLSPRNISIVFGSTRRSPAIVLETVTWAGWRRRQSLPLDGNLALAEARGDDRGTGERATSGFDDFQVRLPRPVMSPTDWPSL